ncbi:DNA methyltransferase [Sedimentibacter sp.]|uniref:DNA methyltransferase n=1 Tax=Sedimentibacter sp. TaxID=1960295 RepID=UPI0028A9F86B|nr:DNA methyltransferase [Sedimentibacter sp.]
MTNHKIVIGDSRQLNKIKDKSVQLIITSPPYWQLKDYGTPDQIGFNDSYEEYINNLNLVWKECYRVLSDGCRMCINIGDQFARSVYYGRYKVIPIRTEIIRFCEELGMDYMGAVIWQKSTTMNTTGGGAVMGSYPYPRNGILKIDYEFILIFKKLGKAPKPTLEQKNQSELSKEEWGEYFSSHWNFGGVRQQDHIAMFPEELPKRLIKMFSFVGETVFDPFLGSGTTSLAAKNLQRNSIGYEINKEFVPTIYNKLCEKQLNILESKIEFIYDNLKKKFNIDDLPYMFYDPHKLDKKVDVKKLSYGSKIDSKTEQRENYYTVKEIFSPEILLLSNGIKIRLIGIKTNPDYEKEAIDFLKNKLNKNKVFMKYDQLKYDCDNNLLCYLYLSNKTFINNHLIRTKFVNVDKEFEYSCKSKFIKTYNENN